MFDILEELAAIHRTVARDDSGGTVSVTVSRTYPADAEDVWDALTTPERLARWFAPVSGNLVAGGTFQIEGNAGGEILRCDRPSLLRMTFGGPESLLDVRTTTEGGSTTVALIHSVPLAMAGSGAGALFVGPGWDGALVALARHHRGELTGDPMEAANAPDMVEFNRGSIERWTDTIAASGTATSEEIAELRAIADAQYVPE